MSFQSNILVSDFTVALANKKLNLLQVKEHMLSLGQYKAFSITVPSFMTRYVPENVAHEVKEISTFVKSEYPWYKDSVIVCSKKQ